METNCTNCGGVLSLEHYADRLSCKYCGTVHLPSLREDGHIEKLDGPTSTTDCPLCNKRLSHARLGDCTFLYCGSCRGLLIDGRDLLKIILYSRQRTDATPRSPDRIDPEQLKRKIECPHCHKPMNAHPYYGPGDFVIDSCSDCKRVWLDGGELGRAADVRWGGSLWQ